MSKMVWTNADAVSREDLIGKKCKLVPLAKDKFLSRLTGTVVKVDGDSAAVVGDYESDLDSLDSLLILCRVNRGVLQVLVERE